MNIKAIVKDYVVDLRSSPNTKLENWKKDSSQLSQLLLGEHVHVLFEEEDWSYVEVLQQLTCDVEGKSAFYKGYVSSRSLLKVDDFKGEDLVVLGKHKDLSLGTRLKSVKEMEDSWEVLIPGRNNQTISKKVVSKLKEVSNFKDVASLFLGSPYLWGGRSSFCCKQQLRSVDCSGFVDLVYSILGYSLPRDSKDQFLFGKSSKDQLPVEAGDLLFLSKSPDPQDIFHVMMVFDCENLIESCEASPDVRIISSKERLGEELYQLSWNQKIENNYLFWMKNTFI
jgi:hypothetical protein